MFARHSLRALCIVGLLSASGARGQDLSPVEDPVRSFEEPPPTASVVEASRFAHIDRVREEFEVSGQGFTVAVLDTGLRRSHVDFPAAKLVAVQNFTGDNGGETSDVADGHGHGTHICGIIAGAGQLHRGVAPEATIAALKVIHNQEPPVAALLGGGPVRSLDESLDTALQWVLDNHAVHRITVVNLSLSDHATHVNDEFPAGSPRARVRDKIIELKRAKVAVVASAGNKYHAHSGSKLVDDCRMGMGFPAIIRETISVGAVYDDRASQGMTHKNGARSDTIVGGQIAPFSQRLNLGDGIEPKTDIFAPGGHPIASSGHLGDNGVVYYDGTSQATAMVAGVVLLLQQYYFRATGEMPSVDSIEIWLRAGGEQILDGDDEDDNVRHSCRAFVSLDASRAIHLAKKAVEIRLATSAASP
jgi:subtilisin family serine protease